MKKFSLFYEENNLKCLNLNINTNNFGIIFVKPKFHMKY